MWPNSLKVSVINSGSGTSAWLSIFFLGLGLVLFGMIVLLHPELLAYLFAGFLIFVGVGVISMSFALKGGSSAIYRATSFRQNRDSFFSF